MNLQTKYYKLTDPDFWKGRIDSETDPDSFRIHQVIRLIDLVNPAIKHSELNILYICIIGYCCDEGIKLNLGRTGAKYGPIGIRRELANLPASFGNNALIYDAGDIVCNNGNMADAQQQLAVAVNKILDLNMLPIVAGGGHELAFGHFIGISNHLQKNDLRSNTLGIINFDAHFDLRPVKQSGSSGTMFTQIAERCQTEQCDFNYFCIGIQKSANTKSLFKKAEKLGVEYILAKDFKESDHEIISKQVLKFVDANDHIYLTVCSDVFNSAFAPGVSSIQPFGLNPEFVLIIIKEIISSKKLISFDIAEVSPRFDHDNRTAKLAAIIIYAIILNLTTGKEL